MQLLTSIIICVDMLDDNLCVNANIKGRKMDIYVGNLAYNTTAEDLIELFSAYGTVTKANIVTDRETRRSKGFGFVTMENNQEANNAINALNGKEVQGRVLRINAAEDKPARPPRQSRY